MAVRKGEHTVIPRPQSLNCSPDSRTFFSKSPTYSVLETSSSLPCQTSRPPALDNNASRASKLCKPLTILKLCLNFNKQRLEDLAVEEQNLQEEFESRLKQLEVRRAAVLADQDKEIKLR